MTNPTIQFDTKEVIQLYINLITSEADLQKVYALWRRLNFVILLACNKKLIQVNDGNELKSQVLDKCMDKVADAILLCGNRL